MYFTCFMSIEPKSSGFTMFALRIRGQPGRSRSGWTLILPPGRTPDSLNFELDENDGLHAVWFYGALDRELRADWVRYIHSLDGGETWSSPFMIDQYVEESQHNLTSASPVMTVQGTNVYVVWAAGPLPYRNYRFSADAGLTWSESVRIFGELHGQAFDGWP